MFTTHINWIVEFHDLRFKTRFVKKGISQQRRRWGQGHYIPHPCAIKKFETSLLHSNFLYHTFHLEVVCKQNCRKQIAFSSPKHLPPNAPLALLVQYSFVNQVLLSKTRCSLLFDNANLKVSQQPSFVQSDVFKYIRHYMHCTVFKTIDPATFEKIAKNANNLLRTCLPEECR